MGYAVIGDRRFFTYRAICAHDIFDVAGVFATLGVATRCTGAAGEANPLGALLPPHVAGVLPPHAGVIESHATWGVAGVSGAFSAVPFVCVGGA